MPKSVRVVVVEDDRPFREHLAALIHGAPGHLCAGAYGSMELALKNVGYDKPDVLLLDLELPGMPGLEGIRELISRDAKLNIIVLTVHDDAKTLFEALEAGASGYLHKPPTTSMEILDAIAEIRAGGAPMSSSIARLVLKSFHTHGRNRRKLKQLTRREEDILSLVSEGCQNKEIASQLGVLPSTVATHLRSIYEKLQVHSRAAATAAWAKR